MNVSTTKKETSPNSICAAGSVKAGGVGNEKAHSLKEEKHFFILYFLFISLFIFFSLHSLQ
jgi:hypothetical protein